MGYAFGWAMQKNATAKGRGRCDVRNTFIGALLMIGLAATSSAQQGPSPDATTNAPAAVVNVPPAAAPLNQAGTVGLGPLFGEPMGLGAKVWLSQKAAIDAGAAWSFVDPDGCQLHGDFLYHIFDLFQVGEGEMPLYFGVGGRVKFVEHGDNRAGIRGPVGVSYLLHRSRLEVFAEVAPVLDVSPTTTLEWNGGVGLRYYFH
jgi:hypothetical protein